MSWPAAKATYLNSANIAAFGDSITDQNNYGSAVTLRSIGHMNWAVILSGGKLNFNLSLNFGISGQTTTQMVARIDANIASMKALNAKFCVVLAGTNDISGGMTIADTANNLTIIYTKLLQAGITPIAIPITPRSYAMTTALRRLLSGVNRWIRNYCSATPGIMVVDVTLQWTDQSDALGDPIGKTTASTTALTYDGLHPGARGAYWIGLGIVRVAAARLDTITSTTWSQIDLYDAVNNPYGDLLANPFMTGTAGTGGTRTSGSIATSYTAKTQGGTTNTLVCSKGSKVIDANTYPTQLLVSTAPGGTATEGFQMYQQVFSNISIGDTIYGECEISVSGVTAGSLKSLTLACTDGVTVATTNKEDPGVYQPDQSWAGVLRTMPFTTTVANLGSLTLGWALDGTVASAGVMLEVTRFSLNKAP